MTSTTAVVGACLAIALLSGGGFTFAISAERSRRLDVAGKASAWCHGHDDCEVISSNSGGYAEARLGEIVISLDCRGTRCASR